LHGIRFILQEIRRVSIGPPPRARRERPRDCRAAERSQQLPPSDGD